MEIIRLHIPQHEALGFSLLSLPRDPVFPLYLRRHTGQLQLDLHSLPTAYQKLTSPKDVSLSFTNAANAAIFVVLFTLVTLGYFWGLKKSILVPSFRVPYLGFISDSDFICKHSLFYHRKRLRFLIYLHQLCLVLKYCKSWLESVSLSLAVPAARFSTNEINLAISRASRSARPVRLLGPLRAELEHWLFLESWERFLPWRSEFHRQVTLYSDVSRFACRRGSFPGAFPHCISD